MNKTGKYSDFGLLLSLSLMVFILSIVSFSPMSIAQDWQSRDYKMIGANNGQTLKLGNIIGKQPVYLKLWASWCKPCREQMPHFVESYNKFGDKVTFVAVNIDVNDDIEAVKSTIAEFGMTMPVIMDERGQLAFKFKLVGTPMSVLIDAKGQVVYKSHKAGKALDDKLAQLASNADMLVFKIRQKVTPQRPLVIRDSGITSVFFTATWCDWYLKDTRPQVSENCLAGQKLFNQFSRKYPKMNPIGVLSPLWTALPELKDYQRKHRIIYRQIIDIDSKAAVKYQVKDNPTLVVFKDGIEVMRLTDFSDEKSVEDKFKAVF